MAGGGNLQLVKAGYWLTDSSSSFPAANINTDLFTHVFCAFADLDPTTKKVTVSSSTQPQISTFSATIKQKDPNVKTLLSIGGDGAKPESFALMSDQLTSRKAFIDSSISLARQHQFDGLDLQWLYPSKKLEMANLGSLLSEWHDAAVSEAQQQGKPQLLLVATVFYSPYLNSLLYPVEAMKSNLDWINVMAYDFYTPASSNQQAGPAAAFFNTKTTSLSGSYGLQQWLKEQNYPSSDIVLGIPFFGWAWLLLSASKHAPFSPTDGPATGQMGMASDGRIHYGDITKLIGQFSATTVFDPKEIFSYAYYNTNWIAYDDGHSVSAKISQARSLRLLGYFAWHIGGDDEDSTLAITASQQWDA